MASLNSVTFLTAMTSMNDVISLTIMTYLNTMTSSEQYDFSDRGSLSRCCSVFPFSLLGCIIFRQQKEMNVFNLLSY